jgi:hypothetical protein
MKKPHSHKVDKCGTVFGEILWLTQPIIYQKEEDTEPITLLFGSVRLIWPGTKWVYITKQFSFTGATEKVEIKTLYCG